ncbi:aromatic acid exporter family protein [Rubrobacter marinus]|uniref:Aromatic acid exporter family protein n=1 Tax=Rubrobacter marinus TaxID=2653852 RepID=A0A6G8PYY1_9ACTN|nr:FUSC family protein [Rubrobacter marinus]QIN79385.1 aromatic acid exporter family protein [Rubrobacter marinus]
MNGTRGTGALRGAWRSLASRFGRLPINAWPILQAAVAAGLAYFLASTVLGNEQPFFAPVAAVVTLSLAPGERGRRAFEVALGVAVGLAIADVAVRLIGVGAAQIAVVVALAMAAAVLIGEQRLLVNQAAISAILVVVLQPPDAGFSPDRFFNALVGSGVALAVSYLFPLNPERLVERAARPIFDELAAALDEIAGALEGGDRERAERLLERVRELDERVRSFNEALSAGHETARLSPTGRRSLKHLELYSGASIRIELSVINTRVLARGTANVLRRGEAVPRTLPGAIRELSRAVRALGDYLEEESGPEAARRCALEAARNATETLKERHELGASVLVGQVRSMAVDLLRSTGMNQAEALAALEEAAPRSSAES